MSFNWRTFLTGHGIAFIESGPNVAKGNVNVHCPMCGSSDSSYHLGISLEGRGWGCWRNSQHRGKSNARLIAALIGCSLEEAHRLAGSKPAAELGPAEDFGDSMAALLGMAPEPTENGRAGPLRFMREMQPLDFNAARTAPPFNYLTGPDRDYTPTEAQNLCHEYGLRYATTGPFAYRIIIPVEMAEGLVNWTGRHVGRTATLRYRTLSMKPNDEGIPLAKRTITDCLWNYRALLKDSAETLVVVEGPFDALRLDYFGSGISLRATCLFGKNLSKEQAYLLGEISDQYKHKLLLLDRDASLDAFQLNDQVAHFGFKVHTLEDQKDPALFSPQRIRQLKSLR